MFLIPTVPYLFLEFLELGRITPSKLVVHAHRHTKAHRVLADTGIGIVERCAQYHEYLPNADLLD